MASTYFRPPAIRRCNVFISGFRNETLAKHIRTLLCGKSINTFFDDQPSEGDAISPSAIHAIEGSKIAVVNLSEQYASSGQCLDELVKIMECKNNNRQEVIPVFHQVDPSDVRNQTGNFGQKFSKLKERFNDNETKLQTWGNALIEAADLTGFESHFTRFESELVQRIVEAILKILNANKFPSGVYKDLVGADVHIPPPTPPPRPQNKYDAYISFSVEDTRKNFLSHFHTTLIQKQIKIFIDDEKFIKGDAISPSVVNAIEESKAAVVILSKGYVSSARCLNELAEILECKKKNGQIVIPVFYGVRPSDVKNQTGNFGDEFSKIEERFKDNVEKVQTWRNALKEAADLPGPASHAIRPESLLVEKTVEYILRRLKGNLDKALVGVESCLKDIEALLSDGWAGVDRLGIWGISGIGKTTIANVIFNEISKRFDDFFFVENIRKELEKIDGLINLQRNLLSMLFENENWNVGIPTIGINSRERLSYKKVLVVFDNVTCLGQIESSLRILDRFMPGSLIIITAKNEQVLRSCGVKKIYEMTKLIYVDALKLFSWHAFGQDHPDAGYKELSRTVIQYAQGIPLALKILGRFLSGKSKEEWESTINKLKGISRIDIQNVLRVSYDGLNDKEQNIFLKITCFLIGEDRDRAIKFLDPVSGSSAEEGLSVLIDKRLVTISDNNKIAMHPLLQEMGREIAWNDLGKGSRLRHHKDNTNDDSGTMFAATSLILEILSSVFEQLSSVQKSHYALVSILLSSAALFLCIIELVYKVRNEKVTWKWSGTSSGFYYSSETHGHDKRFGNFKDLTGLGCTVIQWILIAISFVFVYCLDAQNPIKISAWPIVFAAGVLYSKMFFDK